LKDVGYWNTEYSAFDKSSPFYAWALPIFYDDPKIEGQQLRVPVGTVLHGFHAQ
jgi:hypothetical protein